MHNIKFSVIIPAFNAECYLSECLDSILNQSYKNYEIILVDDGSSDKTQQICEQYAQNHKAILFKRTENQGALLARRTALSLATGDYTICVDADDMLRSDALEEISGTILRTSGDLIIFNFSRESEYKVRLLNFPFSTYDEFAGDRKALLYRIVLSGPTLNNLCNKAVSIKLWDIDTDYSDYKGFPTGEDLLQILPILTAANKVVYIDESLYFYRTNPDSITHVFNINKYYAIKKLGTLVGDYCEIWKMYNERDLLYSRNITNICNHIISMNRSSDWRNRRKEYYLHFKKISNDDFFKISYRFCRRDSLSYIHRITSACLKMGSQKILHFLIVTFEHLKTTFHKK